jgi:hypothetical protein
MSAAIDPSGQRYALFIKPIEVELEKYINTSDYYPTKSQLAQFERNCALLKPGPDLASMPLTSRKRNTSAQSNIQKMYEKLDADLFILCTIATPKTKLASFDSSWMSKLSNWWNRIPTPSRLSDVALELCNTCGLSYSPRKRGSQPHSEVIVDTTTSLGLGLSIEAQRQFGGQTGTII